MALRPALRRKVDELFLRWLSEPDTQRLLRRGLRRVRACAEPGPAARAHCACAGPPSAAAPAHCACAGPPTAAAPAHCACAAPPPAPARACALRPSPAPAARACAVRSPPPSARPPGVTMTPDHHDPLTPDPVTPMNPDTVTLPRWLRPPPQAEPRPAAGVGGRGSWRAAAPDLRGELALLARGGDLVLPSRVRRRLRAAQQAQSRRAAPPSPPPPAGSRRIPSFHFPLGRPPPRAGDVDAGIARVEAAFARLPQERATARDMGAVAKACGCPLYWKAPLFYAAGGDRAGSVSVHKFVAVWRKILHTCHDDAARFVHLLMGPGCNYLVPEDFVPFLQDVVNTHPGLSFLKEASEFHSRYITTVIQRIFYTVNRSWSGRITCTELRRSSFLQNVALLEEEADINQLTEFFSYEHFYVIYCKFWELDTDHDLLIDARDLARHADHAISTRMIDRIFSGAVTR
ncbi:serine/threonine-protein phosphatase 2A regulatory subunit B'' subunit beta-like [Dipodomys spectabilis]|uniref:serine/threonine-protein phosphatase 2A regulatory subunit B'' subunit beta-like n=1 Tax=Dipodomys spectabilis TaxID=105255 RepID=UPI001C53A769|nr:serine/threonine-protein phosphatase 2A regulatory subunit B'' subunit beta-like [Dipodomys spectabilis]